jgi:hypothetical protein
MEANGGPGSARASKLGAGGSLEHPEADEGDDEDSDADSSASRTNADLEAELLREISDDEEQGSAHIHESSEAESSHRWKKRKKVVISDTLIVLITGLWVLRWPVVFTDMEWSVLFFPASQPIRRGWFVKVEPLRVLHHVIKLTWVVLSIATLYHIWTMAIPTCFQLPCVRTSTAMPCLRFVPW